MDLFTLVGKIVLDMSDMEAKMDSTMASAARKFQNLGSSMTKTGVVASAAITTPIIAIGKKAIDVAADFEYGMSEVAAISGATGDDLAALTEKAKEMGEKTKFSASDAADGLKYMAMAGWKTEDMLNGLEGILNLAAASGEDLGITSDIVTDALTAFGLTAADSGHFADVLAKASSNANTNVAMMGETFKYVAPVAGTLGFSAEDVALAVGLMANSGIKASQAGTSLRASLTNLAAPTKDMQETMVSLGLATSETAYIMDEGKLQKAQSKVESKTIDMEKAQIKYNDAITKYGEGASQAQTAALNLEKAQNNLTDAIYDLNVAQKGEIETTGISNNLLIDSQGNTKSLREVILTLRDAFKGLSEEEQAQAASTLFGKEAMSGMLAIINASDDDFNKLVSAIDDADGAAKDMADTMNNNLSGQMTLLKSQLEGLAIQFVTLIMPYLRQGVDWLSKLLTWISSLDDGTKKMIITVAGIAAAVGPALIVAGRVVSSIGSIIGVGGKIIGGIGKLSGGISSLMPVISSLIGGGGKVIGGIGSLVAKLGGSLLPALAAIPAPVWIVIGIIGALVAAGVALYKNWDTVSEWGKKTWESVKGHLQGLLDFVKGNWQGILLFMANPVVGGFKLIYDNCPGFKEFIDNFLSGIKQSFHDMGENIKQKVTDAKEAVVQRFGELKENVSAKVEELKENTAQKFEELKEKTSGKIEELKEKTVNKFNEMKEKTVAKAAELQESAVSKFEELKEKASNKVEELKEKAVSKIGELKEKAVSRFEELKEKSVNKLGELKSRGENRIQELKEKGISLINDMKERGIAGFSKLASGAVEKIDSLKSGITQKLEAVKEVVRGAVEKLKDFFRFDWELPKIKLPHFSMSGGFSLNPPSIPHIDVEWYKGGGIMMKPTAFGINPFNGKTMAGGESGPEAIAPIELLKTYIKEAMEERESGMMQILASILALLGRYLPELSNMQLVLDTGAAVGALAPGLNSSLGSIYRENERIR